MRLLEGMPVWARWVLALSLLFNLGFVATFGFRWCASACGGPETAAEMCCVFDQIRLDPSQRSRAEKHRQSLLADVQRLQHQLAVERKAMMELMLAAEPDPVAIDRQIERIAAAQADVQRRVAEHFLAERRSLPPEQRRAFEQAVRVWVCPQVGAGLAGEACAAGCGVSGGARPERPATSD